MRVILFFLAAAITSCAAAQNVISLHVSTAKDTISRHIYGHFAEHLGHGIYGGLYVGQGNTNIPNKDGVRLDVVAALQKLKIPNLRWPGGCFAESYHWKDAIGPQSGRKPIENFSSGGVREDNSFGTNEFLDLCETLSTEPYLAINLGGGTVEEASDWVKYTNHPNGTSWLTDMRLKTGRTKPWNVKFWGIGNESWDCGGHMSVDYYIKEYKKYATFISSYNNSEGLFRIAVGPGSEDYAWTESLMRGIPLNMMEGISMHHYSVIDWNNKGSATAFDEAQYFRTMEEAWVMERMVSKNSAIMDRYDARKKVALVIDEWGGWYNSEPGTNGAFLYQQSTMRDAMIAGMTLNIFNNHADRVKMANLAQTVNVLQAVILTKDEKMILTPTYHVMEMYNVHQDGLQLPLTVKSDDYEFNGKKLPAVSASASRDKNGIVHISLVNIDARKPKVLTIELNELAATSVSGRILQSNHLQDKNSFEAPDTVHPSVFQGAKLEGKTVRLTLPPFSVVVLELKTF